MRNLPTFIQHLRIANAGGRLFRKARVPPGLVVNR